RTRARRTSRAATYGIATPRSAKDSTTNSSTPTSCCAGSTGPARRCSSYGVRGVSCPPASRARAAWAATSAICSRWCPTTASWSSCRTGSPGSDSYRASHLRRPEYPGRHAALPQRLRQLPNRLVYPLRRQLKRAVVHREAPARAEIEMRLHGFRRIHMDVFHEPAWLVGADREQRQIDRSEPRGNLPEMGAVAGIAGKQQTPAARLDQEPTPQRAVAVERAARGEMLRRRQRDRKRRGARALPPVELLDITDARRLQQPAVAKRGHEPRMKPSLQRSQGREIAVVVMIVTEQHERDGGQIVEAHARRPHAARARERNRARALRVHRIDQQADGADLDEKRGMTDERDRHVVRADAGRPPRLDGERRRPAGARREQHARHPPEGLAIGAVGIVKPAPVEMGRHRGLTGP